jgi:glutamyl-tRNA synthetase
MQPEILTPLATETIAEIEARYPVRDLPAGACVTRFGPSPTGSLHIGGLYTSMISRQLAHQSGGLFLLRIEDTDKKREVEGAIDLIVDSLRHFGLSPDEGELTVGHEVGKYGPYRQSARTPIYQTFVRNLLERGLAYPCFASPEELAAVREQQQAAKIPPGYYGKWALWRERPEAEAEQALAEGRPFAIRLKTPADRPAQVTLPDVIRGELNFPSNEQDVVLLKADGTPTYHLAHVVDDRLMGTTHVIRGHEWLSSYPLHAQLFGLFGWEPPLFAHISPIEKMEGSSRRKLSKRKDPEASVSFYVEQGYPQEAVLEYLLTLADGRFEDWRAEHPEGREAFAIDLTRMSRSGALFDSVKLDSISRERIADMTAVQVYAAILPWAKDHAPDFAERIVADPTYATAIFDIERGNERARKDLAHWSTVPGDISFFFDDLYAAEEESVRAALDAVAPSPPADLLRAIAEEVDPGVDRDTWLEALRAIGGRFRYAPSMKIFKQDPEAYVGHFGNLTEAVRVVLTGRRQSPDLHEIMQVMGRDRVKARLLAAADWITNDRNGDKTG